MKPDNIKHSDLTPIDEIDRDIVDLCSRINAATYELLVLIREFDERAGWLQWGRRTCLKIPRGRTAAFAG